MIEAQIQLQKALTTTFLANLVLLSEYDNDLYQKVDELSRMIEKGTYKEKYALDFIEENGEFDIYDILNDKYLYNKNPKKFNDELVKKIEFDKKNSIFDLNPCFLDKTKYCVDRENRFDYKNIIECVGLTQNDMFEYTSVTKDFLEKENKELKRIKKFIFLGTLLGRHIPRIAEKVNSESYLVLEKNLEIFRLSLFVVDYSILASKSVVFSIMDNEEDEKKKITNFLKRNELDNYLIKLSTTEINISKYIDSILGSLMSLSANIYDYNRNLYIYINRTTKLLNSNYQTLLFNKTRESNFFEHLPILYLAAGPSLDENIEWIVKNQNKFFIVTIGAAYKKLLNYNIHINMITTLDEQEYLNILQFDEKSVSKIDKNTIIVASTMTHESILKKFNENNLFLYEVFIPFHKENIALSGFSIGEVTIDILFQLNAKEIYIIGLDLALNQNTGDTHSLSSSSGIQTLTLEKDKTKDNINFRKSLIKVKGNHFDEVFTTPIFYISIKNLEEKISKKRGIKIFNLSVHGAYIEGTISKRIKDLDENKLVNLSIKNDFLVFLKENSTKQTSKELQKELQSEIIFIQEELLYILKILKNNEFKDFDSLLNEIYKISSIILEHNFYILDRLIGNYIKNFAPYFLYYFNDKKIKEESKIIESIKQIVIKQIKNILDDYTLCLERLIK